MSSQSSPLKPTWSGYIESTLDALLLFEASLKGVISHVPRRPHDRERQDLIKSGSVFIYEEHSSGIKRWTDGVSWSPSRILGNFLIYRELEKPFPPGEKKRALKKKKCANPSGITKNQHTPQSSSNLGYSTSGMDIPKDIERSLIGSLVDSYPFKEDGLVKKTISITYRGVPHHLVSYYTVVDVVNGCQRRPSQDPTFKDMIPRSDLMTQQNFRSPVDEFRHAHTPLEAGHGAYGPVGEFSPNGSILQRAWNGSGMATSFQSAPSTFPLQQVMHPSYMTMQMQQSMQQPMPSLLSQTSANASSSGLPPPPQQHPHVPFGPPHTHNNYSLDAGRASRFGSGPAMPNEFPRQMPTQSPPRRHSNYEHGQPSSELMPLGPLPDVRSDGTNGASVVGNGAQFLHNSYYVPRPNVQLPAPDNHQFPSPASMRMAAGSVGGHVGGHVSAPDGTPQYGLDENTGQWSFDTMDASQGQDQQQPPQQDYYGRN